MKDKSSIANPHLCLHSPMIRGCLSDMLIGCLVCWLDRLMDSFWFIYLVLIDPIVIIL